MLCSSIKLTDRREFTQDKMPKRNKSTMLEEKLFMKSDYFHSYTFRWDKPKKRHYSCNNPQYVTVKDIIFPDHLSKNNNASLVKWSKKKSNRKSISNALPKTLETLENEDALNISVLTDQLSRETEELIEEIKSNFNLEDEEIDPDIEKLIASARESENAKHDCPELDEKKKEDKKRKRSKKKDKDKDKGVDEEGKKDKSKTKTKVIKFSISKPPTPQTVQVIRVDLTSNFSMDEDCIETNRTDSNISDCSKGCGMKIRKKQEIKENLQKQASLTMVLGSNEVNLMCRKLTLKDRNDDVSNNIENI